MNAKKEPSKKSEGKIKAFFKRRWEVIKSIPWYGWVAGIVLMGLQYAIYRLADVIAKAGGITPWVPYIPFDDYIPFIPGFVIVYVFSYAFWIFGPAAVSLTKKDNFINFCIGYTSALLIGFVILTALPTTMDHTPQIEILEKNGDFLSKLLLLVYSSDGNHQAMNLFPSFHCLISLYMYLGVARRKEVSLAFRIYSLVAVFFICLSTIFTKQHLFIDIPAGLAISIIVYFIVKFIDPGKKILEKHANKTKKVKA